MEPTGPNVPTIGRPFASSSLLNFVLSGPFSNFVMATLIVTRLDSAVFILSSIFNIYYVDGTHEEVRG